MKKQSFIDALAVAKTLFYDLSAKQINFTYRFVKQEKQMIFTAVQKADEVKTIWNKYFKIELDSRQERFAICVIEYE